MAYLATIIKVFISSPGDVKEIRAAARDVCNELTALQAESTRMLFEPVMWEEDAVPEYAPEAGPQGPINRQLVEPSDILVAIFWSKLGHETPDAPSGTVSEINRFIAAGKPVLIYQWAKGVSVDADRKELLRLDKYIKSIRQRSLYVRFEELEAFKQNLRKALLGQRTQFRRVLLSAPRALLHGYLQNFLDPLYRQVNDADRVTLRLEDEPGKPEVNIESARIVVLLPAAIRRASQDAVTQIRKDHFVRATIVQTRRPFGVILRRSQPVDTKATIYDIPTPLGALYDLIRADTEGGRSQEVQVDFDTLGQRELNEFTGDLRYHINSTGGMHEVVSLATFESLGIS